ncbi:MAG TPA: YihY/virulence factor BrkB family protein [Candidatus Anaerotignum merdipullorum]|nr:YihY/virulence factor BrkB family protein [Candidatus Anaerotignum merdipullorum]
MDLQSKFSDKHGIWGVLLSTIQGYFSNRIGRSAAAMTYYLLFAMFPFLIFITSLLGLLHLPMLSLDGDVARFLPEDVIRFLNLAISHITANSNNALLTFGLVFTVWFPLRAVSNLMAAVKDIYGNTDGIAHRSSHGIRSGILTMLLILLIPALILLLVLGERALSFVGQYLPISESFIHVWATLRFLPMAAALLFVLSAVYYLSPAQKQPPRYVLPGAVLSMVIWMAFSLLFSLYVDHVGRYSLIYGSIGVIIALLVWMDCSATAMLMGAVFNVALKQNQSKNP